MFDSENVSLVTRIEAGDGVAITHRTNSDGESVFTASIDSTYIANLITTNAGGTLSLSAADEARLAAVEAKLGITTSSGGTITPSTSGTAGTTDVSCTVNGSAGGATNAATQVQLTYSVVGIDGTTLISESLSAAGGSTANVLELGLYSQIRRNSGMLKYLTPSYTNGKIVLTWATSQVGSTFKVVVTQKNANDTITFTVTDY